MLPTALPGIVTGVMLAVARAAGETAPVLLVAGGAAAINFNPFAGQPVVAGPLRLPAGRRRVDGTRRHRAWTAALTLVALVLILTIAAKLLARRNRLADEKEVTTMAKRIEATNVTAYYGAFKAIENITMTVEPKTVTALIGPSGCGKSTFLRSINRMHEVLPGARVEGTADHRRPGHLRPRRRRHRGPPHDRHGLPAAEPVPDHVDLRQRGGRAASSTASARSRCWTDAAEKALRSANLWDEVKDRLGKPGAGLSGGQQQRLCIARDHRGRAAGAC